MKTPPPSFATIPAAACLALLLAAGGAVRAQPAAAAKPSAHPASGGATWGVVAPPASAAADDGPADDYFRDFGELIVRIRSVRWLEEICADAFPGNADLDRRAYADWLQAHRAFVDEMEGQFALIGKRWSTGSPQAAKDGFTAQQLEARADANRAGLRDDFLAKSKAVQQKRCDAYPQILLSRALDLEHALPDLVKSVREGPPAE